MKNSYEEMQKMYRIQTHIQTRKGQTSLANKRAPVIISLVFKFPVLASECFVFSLFLLSEGISYITEVGKSFLIVAHEKVRIL